MAEVKKPDESKELKRLLDAHIEVAKARLGRAPSLDDIHKMLSVTHESAAVATPVASEPVGNGEPKQEVKSPPEADSADLEKTDDSEPGILSMKVYYGVDGEKKPDAHKVLFYESGDGRVYDAHKSEWCSDRPNVLDHLQSRPIQFNERDVVAAIAHGVMGDDDYDALDKAQMISETPRKLWALKKKLTSQVSELEKSLAPEVEELGDSDIEADSLMGDSQTGGENIFTKIKELAGVAEGSEMEADMPGDDVLSQIIQAATSQALTGMEDMIRAIVREEMGFGNSQEDEQIQEEPLDDGEWV